MATLYIVNSNFVPYFFSNDTDCNSSVCSNFAICAIDFKFKKLNFTSHNKFNIFRARISTSLFRFLKSQITIY